MSFTILLSTALAPDGKKAIQKPDPMTEAGLDYQERELVRIARELDPARKEWLVRLVETAVDSGGRSRRSGNREPVQVM